MTELTREEVVAELVEVQPEVRCVFPALCAERILPWWQLVSAADETQDAVAAQDSLSAVWSYAELGSRDLLSMQRLYRRCEVLVTEEPGRHRWAHVADDCIVSVCFALKTVLNGSAEDASWAGSRLRDSVFQFVLRDVIYKGQSGIVKLKKQDHSETVRHPLYVAEVKRQRQDLRDLKGIDTANLKSELSRLRLRAQSMRCVVFGEDSTLAG